jgi:hypothetical protein
MSASATDMDADIFMKMVQGFRGARPVFGVRTPSVTGDLSSSPSRDLAPVSGVDVDGSAVGSPVFSAFSFSIFSARSLSLRSFFSFFFCRSFSAFSGLRPLGLTLLDAGVEGEELSFDVSAARCGGAERSGMGVEDLEAGRAEVTEFGVGATVAVRRYA